MQVARAPATAAMARRPASATTRGLAKLERTDQGIKALAEQTVNLGHHAAELGAIEMALHQVDHILHQQVALHLHDGRRRGADEQHQEIVACGVIVGGLVFVELGIVEGHLNGRALLGQLIESHAHLVERLAKILVAGHRPAQAQHMLLGFVLDTRLVIVRTGRAISQGTRTGIAPQRLERLLQLLKGGISTQ
jgi:hypothetical protein